MSRRTKLIILGIFLVLLVMPAWDVARNWNPPNPLRFRLVSQQSLPDEDGFRQERLEIEVLNTSTAPRYMEYATLQRTSVPIDPFVPCIYLVEAGTVIPAGGTWRGTTTLVWPKVESNEPGPVEIAYSHASTIRDRVMSWYWSLVDRLPQSQHERFWLNPHSQSTAPLEMSP